METSNLKPSDHNFDILTIVGLVTH